MTSLSRQLGILLLAPALGCGYNRVILQTVPEKNAPVQERVTAFKDLVPESGLETHYFQNGVHVGSSLNYVMLANGIRVEDPRDLLPAMEPGTPATTYVQSYESNQGTAKVFRYAAVGGYATGAAVAIIPTSIALLNNNNSTGSSDSWMTSILIGIGVMVLSNIPLFVGIHYGRQAEEDRLSAFQTYPRSLQKRLALDDENAPVPARRQEARLPLDAPTALALAPH